MNIPHSIYALCSIVVFACVHTWAGRLRLVSNRTQGQILSFGSGVAIAYVFIDLLPKLAKNQLILKNALSDLLPFLEKHVYILALVGFLLFFLVDRSSRRLHKKNPFWFSLTSYAIFNFFVGYAVCDKDNPEVKPLLLFTFAMSLHYFVNDFSLSIAHPESYNSKAKWVLIICLLLGWQTAICVSIPPAAVALVSAFIGGGVIMNVTRHELPQENPNNAFTFIIAAIGYTIVLLGLG